jgi:hypothetical protein
MTSPASGHCGPITAACPASHLASVISLMALNRLLHACGAPQTAGDVARLCQDGKLTSDNFKWLGPRRRSEIEAGLVLAGFDISHRVRDAEAGAPSNDQPDMAKQRRAGRASQAGDGPRAGTCRGQRARPNAAVQAAAGRGACREMGTARPGNAAPGQGGPGPAVTRRCQRRWAWYETKAPH